MEATDPLLTSSSAPNPSAELDRQADQIEANHFNPHHPKTFSPSHLLNLPTETRLQILSYVLYSPDSLSRVTRVVGLPTPPKDVEHWRFETGGHLNLNPRVLATCRQLYAEGRRILYSNTIRISIGLTGSFCPVDVLGHWRLDDLVQPAESLRLPALSSFSRFEIKIYCSLESLCWIFGEVHLEVEDLCKTLVLANSPGGVFEGLKVWVSDGAGGEKTKELTALWTNVLWGLRELRCRELEFGGDVSDRCVRYFTDRMLVGRVITEERRKEMESEEETVRNLWC